MYHKMLCLQVQSIPKSTQENESNATNEWIDEGGNIRKTVEYEWNVTNILECFSGNNECNVFQPMCWMCGFHSKKKRRQHQQQKFFNIPTDKCPVKDSLFMRSLSLAAWRYTPAPNFQKPYCGCKSREIIKCCTWHTLGFVLFCFWIVFLLLLPYTDSKRDIKHTWAFRNKSASCNEIYCI